MANGVLYIATGKQYIQEAKYSARSISNHMPEVGITLVTDERNIQEKEFDNIINLDSLSNDPGASTFSEDLSPYDKTLFLDTDTYVTQNLGELFGILDEFDLAVTMSPSRKSIEGLAEPWREYNTGVFAYKSSPEIDSFFSTWGEIYESWREKHNTSANQPSFTIALSKSNLDFFTLPREYNVRIPRIGYITNDVKILHGHHPGELSQIADQLNTTASSRVYWPNSYYSDNKSHKIKSKSTMRYRTEHVAYRFRSSLQRNGLGYTIGRIIEESVKRVKAKTPYV